MMNDDITPSPDGIGGIVREVQLARERLKVQQSRVSGQVQRTLQALADDLKLLRESGLEIDFEAPEFTQALEELGLMSIHAVTASRGIVRTRLMPRRTREHVAGRPPIIQQVLEFGQKLGREFDFHELQEAFPDYHASTLYGAASKVLSRVRPGTYIAPKIIEETQTPS